MKKKFKWSNLHERQKTTEAGNSFNAVEREPVLNPTASEVNYKPKHRSCRKTNLKKKVLALDSLGAKMSSAETAAPNRRRRNVPDPTIRYIYTYIYWYK